MECSRTMCFPATSPESRRTRWRWKEYQVLPNLAHLTAVKQVVPSVKGDILVDIRKEEKSFGLDLVSPAGTMATVGIPKSIGRITQVTVNGETVWDSGVFTEGAHGISKAGEDDSFLMIRIPPGNWKISATAR